MKGETINIANTNSLLNESDNIDCILKKIMLNIFVTLYSEVINDVTIQMFYEKYLGNDGRIQNSEVMTLNETNNKSKDILEYYPIALGIRKGNNKDGTSLFREPLWIVDKLEEILQEFHNKNKINKIFLKNKLILESEKENKREHSFQNDIHFNETLCEFIKDPDYYIFALNELFTKGQFCKDIFCLNSHKGILLSSHYTIMQMCYFILNQFNSQLEKIKQTHENMKSELSNFHLNTLDTFFGEGDISNAYENDNNKDFSRNSIKSGYAYGIKEMNKIVNGKEGLNSLLTSDDLLKLKQDMMIYLKKINNKNKYPLPKNAVDIDLDDLFSVEGKNWNRSTINGSQGKKFLLHTFMIATFIKVSNETSFEGVKQIRHLKEIIEKLNVLYICFGITAIMTITQAFLDRSQFLRKNLITDIEMTSLFNFLGITRDAWKERNSDLPIFCQLMFKENEKLPSSDSSALLRSLKYDGKDFKIICKLLYHIHEEFNRYSIVRYPKSDSPESILKEKPLIIADIIRYVIMLTLLIIFHQIIFNQYFKSPFNIFRKK